jgi:predicted chitinase
MSKSSKSTAKQPGKNLFRSNQGASKRAASEIGSHPHSLHRKIKDLQQAAGNQAVSMGFSANSQHEREADKIAHQAMESKKGVLEFFASRFGLDSSGFTIQTGKAATEEASDLHAKAFTLGRDIFFGEGRYAPRELEGRRLLAHELAHVVQQRALQTTFIQLEPEDKKTPAKVPMSPFLKTKYYNDYKKTIGKSAPPIQAASEFNKATPGTKISPLEIDIKDLKEIMNPGHDPKLDSLMEQYLVEVNRAFVLAQLDTAESQALYLAHAAGETGSFAKLDEAGGKDRDYAPHWGRGPLQVTNRDNYVKALAYLEKNAERLKNSSDPKDKDLAKLAQKAVDDINKNPANALKQEYTFLFSAAFMQMAGGVQRSSNLVGKKPNFGGQGDEDVWMNSKFDNQQELANAQRELPVAKADLVAKKAGGDKKAIAEAEQRVSRLQTKENDFQSRVDRGKVKAKTYEKAMQVLSKKDIAKQQKVP